MAKYKTGQKLTVKNATIDIEITGYFPAGQTADGKEEYAVTINGYKARVKEDFIVAIEITGCFPAGQAANGKEEYAVTINGYKARVKEDFIVALEAAKSGDKNEVKKAEVKTVKAATKQATKAEGTETGTAGKKRSVNKSGSATTEAK